MEKTKQETVDVAIIGAGFSGIGAAARLRALGRTFTVLEARDRVGGRAHTTPDGVDMGASWVSGEVGNSLFELARANGIVLSPSVTKTEAITAFSRAGPLADEERARALRCFAEARARADDAAADESASLEALLTSASVALGHSAADTAAALAVADVAVGSLYASELRDLSGPHHSEPMSEGGEHLVDAGFSAIVACAAREAGEDAIRLGCPVVRVECRADGRGVDLLAASGERVAARAVICTAPLGVLQASARGDATAIAFAPALPERFLASVLRVGFGNMEKLVGFFERDPFPRSDPCICFLDVAGGAGDRRPLCPGRFFTKKFVDGRGVAIVALCTGDASSAVSRLSEPEAKEAFLAQLGLMCGGEELPVCTAFSRSAWAADAYARGSYSFLAVGARPEDRDVLREPQWGGALRFAGEHTQAMNSGYTHGAHSSGAAAADEVSAFLG